MAIVAAMDGNETLDTTEEQQFFTREEGIPCTTIRVRCDQAATVLTFRIPGVHPAGGGAQLKTGETELFRLGSGADLNSAFVQGAVSDAFRWWAVSNTVGA